MDTPLKCLLCSKTGPRKGFETFRLTDAERAAIENPLDEYTYCHACWRLLSHPVHGANIISGIAQMHLTRAGVRDASERTEKFKSALISKAQARKNRQ